MNNLNTVGLIQFKKYSEHTKVEIFKAGSSVSAVIKFCVVHAEPLCFSIHRHCLYTIKTDDTASRPAAMTSFGARLYATVIETNVLLQADIEYKTLLSLKKNKLERKNSLKQFERSRSIITYVI